MIPLAFSLLRHFTPVGSNPTVLYCLEASRMGRLEVLEEASRLAFPVYSLLGVESLNQWFSTGVISPPLASTTPPCHLATSGTLKNILFILAALGLLAVPRLSPVAVSRATLYLCVGFVGGGSSCCKSWALRHVGSVAASVGF